LIVQLENFGRSSIVTAPSIFDGFSMKMDGLEALLHIFCDQKAITVTFLLLVLPTLPPHPPPNAFSPPSPRAKFIAITFALFAVAMVFIEYTVVLIN
jgi:hypothetical protein